MRVLAVLLLLLAACADLPAVEADVCGNRVLDTREDCDGQVDPSLGDGLRCGDECRYVCDHDARCPTGWSCGADDICRPASGKLVAGAAIELPGRRIELADVDGDGRLDVLGDDRARFGVAYGSGLGGFTAPERLVSRRGRRPPLAVEVDGDGRGDLLFDDGDRQYLWLGRANRQLEPTLHPFRQVETALEVDVVPMRWFDEADAALVEVHRGGEIRVVVEGYDDVVLPGGLPVGESLLVELDASLPGQELVIASGRQLYVLGRGRVGEGDFEQLGPLAVHAVVEVDEPLRRGVAAADVDGDGQVDLLTAVDGRWGERLAVAYGDGALGFHDEFGRPGHAMIDDRMQTLGPVERPQVSDPRRLPLAAFHLGDEARDALVSEAGVFVWSFDSLHALDESGGIHLSGAVVSDFNRDGRDDVAVTHVDARGVHLLLARADGTLSTVLFDTAGVPTRLVAGDFDGDLLDDLAFAERIPGAGSRERVAVMYASSPGKLEPAVSLGEVDEVLGLRQAPLAGGSGTDLLVASRREDAPDGEVELVVIEDSPEGRLGSPLRLSGFVVGTDFPTAVGDVVDDEAADLVVQVFDQVLLSPGRGDGSFVDAAIRTIELPDRVPVESLTICSSLATGDFLAGGRDEILLLTGGRCGELEGDLYLVVIEDGARVEVHDLPLAYRWAHDLTPVDLDGDGDDELVLYVESDVPDLLVVDALASGVGITRLPLPGPATGAFAALNLDREPGLELVVSHGPFETIVLDRDAAGAWQRAGTLDVPPARQLRAGDLDGDGLTDLVVVPLGGAFPVPYLAQPKATPGL